MRDFAPDPIPSLKQQLRLVIIDALSGWSQENAAEWLGTDQPRVSNLYRGNLERMSLEQLIRFTTRIKRRVVLVVHDERSGIGRRLP